MAEKAKINNVEWITYLGANTEKDLNRLLSALPKDFEKWVTEYNNLMLFYNKYLSEITKPKIYDIYKCKAIWNLPKI